MNPREMRSTGHGLRQARTKFCFCDYDGALSSESSIWQANFFRSAYFFFLFFNFFWPLIFSHQRDRPRFPPMKPIDLASHDKKLTPWRWHHSHLKNRGDSDECGRGRGASPASPAAFTPDDRSPPSSRGAYAAQRRRDRRRRTSLTRRFAIYNTRGHLQPFTDNILR